MSKREGEVQTQFFDRSLDDAAASGNIEEIDRLVLVLRYDVNEGNEEGATPLHYAAAAGQIESINKLISLEADINKKDKHNNSCLHYATRNEKLEVVKLLLDNGLKVNNVDIHGYSALHYAAGEGYMDIVNLLIEKGADINLQGAGKKITPLHAAIIQKQLMVTQILVNQGADITLETVDNQNALHLVAATNISPDFLKCLLINNEAGRFSIESIELFYKVIKYTCKNLEKSLSNPIIINKAIMITMADRFFNKTDTIEKFQDLLGFPLDIAEGLYNEIKQLDCSLQDAIAENNIEELNALLRIGYDINQGDNQGLTALHVAICNQYIEGINRLLDAGADINKGDNGGVNALHYAIRIPNKDLVDLLLVRGAKVNDVEDKKGFSPLHYVVSNGNIEILQNLLKAGADINSALSESKVTPLYVAVGTNRLEIAKVLLEKNASVHLETLNKKTALYNAALKESPEFIKLLLPYTKSADFSQESIELIYEGIEEFSFKEGDERNISNSVIFNKAVIISYLDRFFNKNDTLDKFQRILGITEEEGRSLIEKIHIMEPEEEKNNSHIDDRYEIEEKDNSHIDNREDIEEINDQLSIGSLQELENNNIDVSEASGKQTELPIDHIV